jgi:hypothetical protein
MDGVCADKLDRRVPEDFWERKMADFRVEEQQVKMAMQSDLALDAQRIFELANKADSLYVSQNPTEKAKLLRILFSNLP